MSTLAVEPAHAACWQFSTIVVLLEAAYAEPWELLLASLCRMDLVKLF